MPAIRGYASFGRFDVGGSKAAANKVIVMKVKSAISHLPSLHLLRFSMAMRR